jgi:hypothetical protein
VLDGLLDSVPDPSIAAPGSSSKEALEHHLRALNAILTDTRTGPLLRDVVAASASGLGLTPDGGHLTGGAAGLTGRMSVCRASVGSTPRSFGSRLPAW